jgi:ribonucleoside-diphosphate reductase beta chain
MSILNLDNNVDYTKEPIFFGAGLNLQRYDKFKYKKFYQAFLNMIEFNWRPEEVHLGTTERSDFNSLSEHEKFIFTSNLKYQILLDSVASRGLKYLMEYLSNPELEAAMAWWSAMEVIHSYSYTYIIKNIYSNPSDIFDHILDDDEIVKRATSVTHYYNELIKSTKDPKKQLYLALVSMNILEGIRFYVSFACSFCFTENGKMEGNAKIIGLIARDENLHMGLTQSIIRILRTDKSEGFTEIAKECEPLVYEMFETAAEEEANWARYLFARDGGVSKIKATHTGMLGLNEDILIKYMQYLTNRRLRGIGLKHIFEGATNPIPWIKKYIDPKNVQVAPQETEIESYKSGAFVQDMIDNDYSEFDKLI